ncbi:TetR/AcrR family transcriptional regulator [Streptomyces agglomeratus]|nr:TetR/AcrR family transcriptional regulator [Streptomyces agglomeratus]
MPESQASHQPLPPTPPRPLRRDARRNREALLEAARAHFAEHGLDASLEQIAKRAGVAIGTLYRHFPTRLDLIQALFTGKLQAVAEAAEQAAAMDDAWEGFAHFMEMMCALQAEDRGLNDLASVRLIPASPEFDEANARIHDLGIVIIRRAHEQGSLRPDVTPEDLALLVWSHNRITHATSGIAPNAWRRYLHLMLDAFRAERAHPLPEPPMSPQQVYEAMVRLGGAAGCTPPP